MNDGILAFSKICALVFKGDVFSQSRSYIPETVLKSIQSFPKPIVFWDFERAKTYRSNQLLFFFFY